MSGIPRDYPVGMNEFLQVIRRSDAGGVSIRLVTVDSRGRALKEDLLHFTAAGDGAASRQGAGADVSSAFTPDPRQPDVGRALHWIASLARPVPGAAPDSPAAVQSANALAILTLLVEAQDDVARKKAQITEAISLLENGTPYEKLHVVSTLQGAL